MIVKPGTNLVIDYFPLWDDSPDRAKLNSYSDRVDVVNIAFALPNSDGSVALWAETNFQNTKTAIAKLRQRGKFVNISIGGATATHWNLSTPQLIQTLAQNTKNLVDQYGANGIDIDYEILDPKLRIKLVDYIKALRALMPYDTYLITYAGWSIGAYGQGVLTGVKNAGHEHPEWGSNKGIDIDVLSQVGSLIDWVNVMSYDAFDSSVVPNFDPTQAINAYRDLLGSANKVVIGFELGPQAWPPNVLIKTEQARPWMQYAVNNNFRGSMFWTLSFDRNQLTKESDGAYAYLIQQVMPKSTAGQTSGSTTSGTSGQTTDQTSGTSTSQTSGSTSGGTSGSTTSGTSGTSTSGTSGTITDGSIPGIETLPQAMQDSLLKYKSDLDYSLKLMDEAYEKEKLARIPILASADPSQLATLQQQYAARDLVIAQVESDRAASNDNQVMALLNQYKLSLADQTQTAPVPAPTPTPTPIPPPPVTTPVDTSLSSLPGYSSLPAVSQQQLLAYKTTLDKSLQQMLDADQQERNNQATILASASSEQVATLTKQFTERNMQLQAAEDARRASNQTQISSYLQQLLAANTRAQSTAATASL